MKECENFKVSLYIRGFCELNPHIHESSNGDRCVCFSVKENSEDGSRIGTQVQVEH